ncbi:MAG: MarC family protein [Candidatus Omnitrophota bacterium]
MFKILEPYLLTFIPIFVVVDVIGNIPLFISLVEGMNKKQRNKVINESVTTAALLAFLFMIGGKLVLRLLGITIADFQVAGGALLFVISLRLLLPGARRAVLIEEGQKGIGVFPLGTPLITGPAVLATTLMMLDTYGIVPTFIGLVLNMGIVWLTLIKADVIIKAFGNSGTRAFSKIMYILLAAISVMMIRRGVMGFLQI